MAESRRGVRQNVELEQLQLTGATKRTAVGRQAQQTRVEVQQRVRYAALEEAKAAASFALEGLKKHGQLVQELRRAEPVAQVS